MRGLVLALLAAWMGACAEDVKGDPGRVKQLDELAKLADGFSEVPRNTTLYGFAAGVARRLDDKKVHLLTAGLMSHRLPSPTAQAHIDEEMQLAAAAQNDVDALMARASAAGFTVDADSADHILDAVIGRAIAEQAEALRKRYRAGNARDDEVDRFVVTMQLALQDAAHGHGVARELAIRHHDPLPPEEP